MAAGRATSAGMAGESCECSRAVASMAEQISKWSGLSSVAAGPEERELVTGMVRARAVSSGEREFAG